MKLLKNIAYLFLLKVVICCEHSSFKLNNNEAIVSPEPNEAIVSPEPNNDIVSPKPNNDIVSPEPNNDIVSPKPNNDIVSPKPNNLSEDELLKTIIDPIVSMFIFTNKFRLNIVPIYYEKDKFNSEDKINLYTIFSKTIKEFPFSDISTKELPKEFEKINFIKSHLDKGLEKGLKESDIVPLVVPQTMDLMNDLFALIIEMEIIVFSNLAQWKDLSQMPLRSSEDKILSLGYYILVDIKKNTLPKNKEIYDKENYTFSNNNIEETIKFIKENEGVEEFAAKLHYLYLYLGSFIEVLAKKTQ